MELIRKGRNVKERKLRPTAKRLCLRCAAYVKFDVNDLADDTSHDEHDWLTSYHWVCPCCKKKNYVSYPLLWRLRKDAEELKQRMSNKKENLTE